MLKVENECDYVHKDNIGETLKNRGDEGWRLMSAVADTLTAYYYFYLFFCRVTGNTKAFDFDGSDDGAV